MNTTETGLPANATLIVRRAGDRAAMSATSFADVDDDDLGITIAGGTKTVRFLSYDDFEILADVELDRNDVKRIHAALTGWLEQR